MKLPFNQSISKTNSYRKLNFTSGLCLLLALTTLSGCLSTRKMSQVVAEKLNEEAITEEIRMPDYLMVKTILPANEFERVHTKRITSYFIPLLFFNAWQHTLECKIGNAFYVDIFKDILIQKAEENQIRNILGDKKLEITIESLPNSFRYNNEGLIMYLIYVTSYSTSESIYHFENEFSVSFQVIDNNTPVKSGNHSLIIPSGEIHRMRNSTNTFIKNGVEKLNIDYINDCEEIINQIFNQL